MEMNSIDLWNSVYNEAKSAAKLAARGIDVWRGTSNIFYVCFPRPAVRAVTLQFDPSACMLDLVRPTARTGMPYNGKFQICGGNILEHAESATSRSFSPQEFANWILEPEK